MKPDILENFENSGTRFGVRIMDNNDVREVDGFLSLLYSCFSVRADLDRAWYDWYYNRNPYGVCNNYVLQDLDKDVIVGTMGAAKIDFVHSGEKKTGGLYVNGMVRKDYGKRGLYTRLVEFIQKNENLEVRTGFGFPHSANIPSVRSFYSFKWVKEESLFFYAKSGNKLSGKHSANVKLLETGAELHKIDFKALNRHDEFYFYKNAGWLKWRYFNRPHRTYSVLGFYENTGKITGYIVLGTYKTRENILKCQIVDLNAQTDLIMQELLLAAEGFAKSGNFGLINIMASQYSSAMPVLLRNEYERTQESYDLFVYPDRKYPGKIAALLGDFDVV